MLSILPGEKAGGIRIADYRFCRRVELDRFRAAGDDIRQMRVDRGDMSNLDVCVGCLPAPDALDEIGCVGVRFSSVVEEDFNA